MTPEERILQAWNRNMPKNRKVRDSKENLSLIRKAIGKHTNFVEQYEEAAPYFQDIDDSGWSAGLVCFHWSLRGDHVERCLADGYRTRSRPVNQYKTPLEQTMINLGLDYHNLGGDSGSVGRTEIHPGHGSMRRQLADNNGTTRNKP